MEEGTTGGKGDRDTPHPTRTNHTPPPHTTHHTPHITHAAPQPERSKAETMVLPPAPIKKKKNMKEGSVLGGIALSLCGHRFRHNISEAAAKYVADAGERGEGVGREWGGSGERGGREWGGSGEGDARVCDCALYVGCTVLHTNTVLFLGCAFPGTS